MIQDFHKTKAVFIFFKDVLSVDPSDHDMIDVGYALSSCDPRLADHPGTVYHAEGREEKQKGTERVVPIVPLPIVPQSLFKHRKNTEQSPFCHFDITLKRVVFRIRDDQNISDFGTGLITHE